MIFSVAKNWGSFLRFLGQNAGCRGGKQEVGRSLKKVTLW